MEAQESRAISAKRQDGPRVCITGMHRSGTSLISQLLSLCGLYLGEEEDLFPPRSDNPGGFWENQKFLLLNERILETFDAGWDLPGLPTNDWQADERLRPARSAAFDLLGEFEGREPWGWKDPRSCLTMPFWMDVIPNLRVAVCIRNPLEVSLSLRRRGNASRVFSMNLWDIYYRRLLEALPEDRYVVTHYEAYLYRPLAELRRVLGFLGIPASAQIVARARSEAIKDLRHHARTTRELTESGIPERVVHLYLQLCERAGWS